MDRYYNRVFFILIIAFLTGFKSQKDYGFVSPVGHSIRISGNFAEYRTNHYHSGIDIKSSKGQIGDPLFSIHDGYISRIKIQSGGYGNVLFITHPNGFTSVYAHMEEFNKEVDEYVKSIQYNLKTFEIEAYLPEDKFLVKRGEQIGLMGTTGRSTGPHLHFELRKTRTDQPVNPFLYGIGPKDDIRPVAQHFAIYNLDNPLKPKRISVFPFEKLNDKEYGYSKTIELEANQIGLGIQMYDKMNGASNRNEVYACQLSMNDSLKFWWKADEFDFDETRYVNARLDYDRKKRVNQKIQLLFLQNCNDLSFVNNQQWDGIIPLDFNKTSKVSINAKDVSGNEIHANLKFKKSENAKEHRHMEDFDIPCDLDTTLLFEDVSLKISKSTFYHSTDFNFQKSTHKIGEESYAKYSIGSHYTPAHKFYKISIKVPDNSDKWCLVKQNSKGVWRTFGGKIKDGILTTYLDEFGDFVLYKDLELPKIRTIRFSWDLHKYSEWRFVITDNLDPDGLLDDLIYNAFVDGEWVRLLYDKKNDLLIFRDLDKINKKNGKFEIHIKDNVGNEVQRIYPLEEIKW